jgi:hypothetical protein
MTTTPPGYGTPAWGDPVVIAAAAMAILDLPADDDAAAAQVEAAATSALYLVDEYLGTPEPAWPTPTIAPPPVIDATVLVTVELYRRKDATFGVLNTWSSADFGPIRVSTDWLKGVESLLHPYMRDHYGVG